tara:strand:+ start:236 stop:985 length:750 start_codon:yes stop_codon:yes gene_type:complete
MINPFNLDKKTFLVSGATSGIGLQLCKEIVNLGGNFIGIGRNTKVLKEYIIEEKIKNSSVFKINLSNESEIIDFIVDMPEIDGFVHCAGIDSNCLIQYYKNEIYKKTQAINVDSCNLILSLLLRNKKIKKPSSIVFVSSISGIFGSKGKGPYAISKASLNIMAKTYSNELAKKGIRVNAIAPGMVNTKIAENAKEFYSEEAINLDKKKYPLGYGDPIDVALSIVFLLSGASKWITGQVLIVDGGRTATI